MKRDRAILHGTADLLLRAADAFERAAFAIDGLVVYSARSAVIVRRADVVVERAATAIDRAPTVVVDEAAERLTLRWGAGHGLGFRNAAGADAVRRDAGIPARAIGIAAARSSDAGISTGKLTGWTGQAALALVADLTRDAVPALHGAPADRGG